MTGKRPMTKLDSTCGCIGGHKVDAITHFTAKLQELTAKLERLRGEPSKYNPAALVVFNNALSAQSAAQVRCNSCRVDCMGPLRGAGGWTERAAAKLRQVQSKKHNGTPIASR